MVWVFQIPSFVIILGLILLLFLGVLALEFWPITLLLLGAMICVIISRKMARKERVEAARRAGEQLR